MTRYFIGFSAKNLPKISNKPIFQQILEQMVDSKPVEQTSEQTPIEQTSANLNKEQTSNWSKAEFKLVVSKA